MKYMIMTFGSAAGGLEAMGRDWMVEMIKFMTDLDEDLKRSGELVSAEGLADGSTAKTVRFQNGTPVPTDGPFAEAKEVIGGYAILEYADKEAALQGCAEFLEVHRQNWPGWEGEIEMRPIISEEHRATAGK